MRGAGDAGLSRPTTTAGRSRSRVLAVTSVRYLASWPGKRKSYTSPENFPRAAHHPPGGREVAWSSSGGCQNDRQLENAPAVPACAPLTSKDDSTYLVSIGSIGRSRRERLPPSAADVPMRMGFTVDRNPGAGDPANRVTSASSGTSYTKHGPSVDRSGSGFPNASGGSTVLYGVRDRAGMGGFWRLRSSCKIFRDAIGFAGFAEGSPPSLSIVSDHCVRARAGRLFE